MAAIIKKINVRMYRGGTGDFFLLTFISNPVADIPFYMMIDCGCIHGGRDPFFDTVNDLKNITKTIDLLVVTHQHDDHINGFKKASEIFNNITFKKVWFAWTEDDSDALANEYRNKYTGIRVALAEASSRLTGLVNDGFYEKIFKDQFEGAQMLNGQKHFISSLAEIIELNGQLHPVSSSAKIPTMVDILKDNKIIKEDTIVEFLSPGDIREKIDGLYGIRFFVLGPPKDLENLGRKSKKGASFEKRQTPSSLDFAFMAALNDDKQNSKDLSPFASRYELADKPSNVKALYDDIENEWKKIDYDWLQGAGSLAMRFEKSINNTSLVLAIQFEESQRVLLFPGDAEFGNWESWHDEKIVWNIKYRDKDEKTKVNAEYLLNNTIFYKVGHHLSQNGTLNEKGIGMMPEEGLVAMATLDFKKINSGWLNTMPNDILGAELIRKTNGKLLFSGDCQTILKNLKTDRVIIKKRDENDLLKNNAKFDNENHVEWDIEG